MFLFEETLRAVHGDAAVDGYVAAQAPAREARALAEYRAALDAGVPLFRGMEEDIAQHRAARARAVAS